VFVHWRDLVGWEGAQLGGWGPDQLCFPRVDVCRVLGCFPLLKHTTNAWLFWRGCRGMRGVEAAVLKASREGAVAEASA